MPSLPDEAEDLLDRLVTTNGGEPRAGQIALTRAVATALDDRRHLLVEAGTGVGKSFGYLAAAVASGRPVVVSTATKGLQDQLGGKDLPAVGEVVEDERPRFGWAVVKGRGSYLCRARLDEALLDAGWTDQGDLFDSVELPGELGRVHAWSKETRTGDRDELPFPVGDWSAYSVSGTECPGRDECPQGDTCFAYDALDRAEGADVVVVNHHLYAAHLATDSTLLPAHDALIVDEAHRFEDTIASALGVDLAPWRIFQLIRSMRTLPLIVGADGTRMQRGLAAVGRDLEAALSRSPVGRFRDVAELPVAGPLEDLSVAVGELAARLRGVRPDQPALAGARARMLRLAGHLVGDAITLAEADDDVVTWVEGGPRPALRAAPIDVARLLSQRLLGDVTMVGTSATLSVGGRLDPMAWRLGMGGDTHPVVTERVESPFDYPAQARLYVAASLPDPRTEDWREAVGDETLALVRASGGRALVLCTSRRMVDLVAERLAVVGEHRLLVQGELGTQAITAAFASDEESVLVATMGFWEGLDVPGRSLQLVVIDRVPFPRPDDPLWTARREAVERAGRSAFRDVDLPRAAMLLAQGAGRLIRSRSDRGVVAILDPRLAKAGYRRDLLASLPPMPLTTVRTEAEAFLRSIEG